MGVLESESRKRARRKNLQRLVLASVAIAGGLAVTAVAPGVIGAMGRLGLIPNKRQSEIINRSGDRLVKRGLLRREGRFMRLTPRGRRELRALEMREFGLSVPKRWDGKWRILVFDIPEKRRGLRDRIRRTLSLIGFVRLQDSVWLYPYDCEDVMTMFKADLRIGKDMLYLVVEGLEYDIPFRRHFNLR